jgi:hypothetical protein
MKEIEVQTENTDKEIIKSNIVKIDETEDRIKVIVTVGSPEYRPNGAMIERVHTTIKNAIKNNCKVITIPNWVKINTIKI